MASRRETTGSGTGEQAPTAPAISLPKGGGAIRGIGEKFAANPVTGTGSLSVPIATSPGRSGFGPQLSISYDSGSGNGPFGFGWSLSLPSVTRKTEKGLPQYQDAGESDVYILSGAEDLVPVLEPDGTRFKDDTTRPGYVIHRYRPRVEGLFARIERWTDVGTGEIHWRSISRDNVTTLYGKDSNSRIFDPADPSRGNPPRVFSWLICESYDDKGSAIVYEYAAENDDGVVLGQASEQNRVRTANRYLKRVHYGNRVSRLMQPDLTQASWLFEVVFDYDEAHYEEVDPTPPPDQHAFVRCSPSVGESWAVRPDPFSSHRARFEVRTYRRCRRVLMFHHIPDLPTGEKGYDGLVRSTEFDYADLDYTQPVTIEDELAHQGSTRFASFIRAVTQSGYVRDDAQAQVVRGVAYATYLKKSLPPLEFEYSKAAIQDQVLDLEAKSLENLPAGLDETAYRWVDLDGEGVSGILTEQAGAWFYKPNLGDGRFGPLQTVAAKPSLAALSSERQQLFDLAGDGQLDLVMLAGPTPGFYERTQDEGWGRFRAFRQLPNITWDEPNLRFVDLDGDGHADVLITDQDFFTWHASLAEQGFGSAEQVRLPMDEERGPRLVIADGTQSIYLADMCGDGLTDLVRVRNGEVCYWPNLGYGHFGAKVDMDNPPWFDNPDLFDQRRVRLADIDGSGTNDIIYLARDGVRLYFNQSGNRLSDARGLMQFPRVDDVSSVLTADLLGNGTACLVWSSPLPADARRPLRYIDLMGGTKPHLLTKSTNNLGAETQVDYAPSTKFYLADKRDGRPWVTRLPFPVHVVERIFTHDRISGNQFVTRYAYHHGYFDGFEREFRGFGLVEQWDTQEFAALIAGSHEPVGTNVEASSHVPPVLTKTWFHTGVDLRRGHVSEFLAGSLDADDIGGDHRELGLGDAQAGAALLDDTAVPAGLTVDEEREAFRALKGSELRQEIYALDGSESEGRPYQVSERSYTVKRLQQAVDDHAVFFVHPRETLTIQYERALYLVAGELVADPRVGHQLILAVDEFGNPLRSVSISYGRRHDDPDPILTTIDRHRQRITQMVLTEASYTNSIEEFASHRTPRPAESRVYEVLGLEPNAQGPGLTNFFGFQELTGELDAVHDEVPYEQWDTDPASLPRPARRLVQHDRTLYRRDDLTGSLALGELQPMALSFESYRLALADDLVRGLFSSRIDATTLADAGGYAHDDAGWWIPSGQTFFSPAVGGDVAELDEARSHFFLQRRFRDPFGACTEVSYDDQDLFILEVRDPLGNQTSVQHDYRVLQPRLLVDANGNRTEVALDALGWVVGTAVMGKQDQGQGDSLAGFDPDTSDAAIAVYFADPLGASHELLGNATTRIIYDLFAFLRTRGDSRPQPALIATLARETHASDLGVGQRTASQHGLAYSDGFGREIQRKVLAEPGPVDHDGPDISPRWVGSGWTIFNNKGKPVLQYEPFFSDSPKFEFAVIRGVSSVLFYDPMERVVATVHPNNTWEKVSLDPWHQATWDVNDTVLLDPSTDPVIGGYVRPHLASAGAWLSWHSRRVSGELGDSEQAAAERTAAHAGTPSQAWLDNLGRPFLTIEHNRADGVDELFATRVRVDIQGNEREVVDAVGRTAMRYSYDMVGKRVLQASMEAGERLQLFDVTGRPIRSWSNRGFRTRIEYDALRRLVSSFVQGGDLDTEVLEQAIEYGESQPVDQRNLRTRVFRQRDPAGLVTNEAYDFKGNLLAASRQLAVDYRTTLDWSGTVTLEDQLYTVRTTYDALNRPTTLTAPDGSVVQAGYNEASLLEQIAVSLPSGEAVAVVNDIDYNSRGQRTLCVYGNDTQTEYDHDPLTFRLATLRTLRGSERLQGLSYTYDPVGNIVRIQDDAQQSVFFRNRLVEPRCDYTYDASYRLVEATGREHLGQVGGTLGPVPTTQTDTPRVGLLHPGDGDAMGRYAQRYAYDQVGNLLEMTHHGTDPARPGWRRSYHYEEANPLEPDRVSNRLTNTSTTDDTASPHAFLYDAHGNMTSMPELALMRWNQRDQMQASARQVVTNGGTPETTYYVYDASAQRVRKVTESQAPAGQVPTRRSEHIYLSGFEIHRKYGNDGATVELERETLHIVDNTQHIALVETRTVGNDGSMPQLIRYQLANHIGSTNLELDEQAQIISYEEYNPYGGTTYQATRSQTETPKRYRFTGKERDEETGLNYHGARYYAPWIARWVSCDPRGIEDAPNMFEFARSNPLIFTDPTGTQSWLVEGINNLLRRQQSQFDASPVGELDPGDPPRLFVPLREPSGHSREAGGAANPPEGEYFGFQGMLHRNVLEPNRRAYASWMKVGPKLASSWGEKVPIGGQFAGLVVGTVPFAAGVVGDSVTRILQFFIPKTEEETFVFVMTFGTGVGVSRAATVERELAETGEIALAKEGARGTAARGVTVYRGTSITSELQIHAETGQLMSDAARVGYVESGGSISAARVASERAHSAGVSAWGSEGAYAEAHGVFGHEISQLGPRSMISVTTDPTVAKNFAGPLGRVFSAILDPEDLIPQTFSGAGEHEFFVRHLFGGN